MMSVKASLDRALIMVDLIEAQGKVLADYMVEREVWYSVDALMEIFGVSESVALWALAIVDEGKK